MNADNDDDNDNAWRLCPPCNDVSLSCSTPPHPLQQGFGLNSPQFPCSLVCQCFFLPHLVAYSAQPPPLLKPCPPTPLACSLGESDARGSGRSCLYTRPTMQMGCHGNRLSAALLVGWLNSWKEKEGHSGSGCRRWHGGSHHSWLSNNISPTSSASLSPIQAETWFQSSRFTLSRIRFGQELLIRARIEIIYRSLPTGSGRYPLAALERWLWEINRISRIIPKI